MMAKPKLNKFASAMSVAAGKSPLEKRSSVAATAARLPRPPSREGKKAVSGFFDAAVSKQLRQLALDRETSVQNLLAEALNDLFEKHGKPSIA